MALVYSYLYVFAVIGLAIAATKWRLFQDEGARKFIHIGVGSWILVVPLLFDNLLWALIPPFTFIGLNYLSYKYRLIPAMERSEQSTGDLGTVYYAISLFVILLLDHLLYGGFQLAMVPILALVYGDGIAAIIGMKFPSRKLVGNKTLYGTITMFLVTLLIGVIVLPIWWVALLAAMVATVVELVTPRGFDNLSIPLAVYILLVIVFL